MSLKVRLQEQEDQIAKLTQELEESQTYNDHLLDEIEKLRDSLEKSEENNKKLMTKVDELLAQMAESESEEEEEEAQEVDPELETLHGYIKRGDTELFRNKLKDTSNLEYRDGSGRTMLIAAVFYQKADIVDLLAKKANKYTLGANSESAMHCAVTSGNIRMLRTLLEAEHPVNLQDGKGRSPLHVACQLGPKMAAQIVPLLLAQKADPELKDAEGFNALHYAVDSGLEPDLIRQMATAAEQRREEHKGVEDELDALLRPGTPVSDKPRSSTPTPKKDRSSKKSKKSPSKGKSKKGDDGEKPGERKSESKKPEKKIEDKTEKVVEKSSKSDKQKVEEKGEKKNKGEKEKVEEKPEKSEKPKSEGSRRESKKKEESKEGSSRRGDTPTKSSKKSKK